jgi:glycosyltransferase involved in cell wall biosynthesis
VLGTRHTCLPDLGDESDGIFLTEPGSVEQLVGQLERLAREVQDRERLRDAARACAKRFAWATFREGIQKAVRDDLRALEAP